MKTAIKTIACTVAMSIVLSACNDVGTNSTEQNTQPGITEGIPAMASSVVSSQEYVIIIKQQLGDQLYYEGGFITDKDILKLWFPHIFNSEQTESECNYFALLIADNSTALTRSYEILSHDMVLHRIGCTLRYPPGGTNGDVSPSHRAMLICDDKDWKLKESINLDSRQFFRDPNWECESGEGGPNWEDIYF